MYRIVCLYLIRENISIDDERCILESFNDIKIDFSYNSNTEKFDAVLNGENVENEIRSVEVNKIV
jgi:cytidylate kinase